MKTFIGIAVGLFLCGAALATPGIEHRMEELTQYCAVPVTGCGSCHAGPPVLNAVGEDWQDGKWVESFGCDAAAIDATVIVEANNHALKTEVNDGLAADLRVFNVWMDFQAGDVMPPDEEDESEDCERGKVWRDEDDNGEFECRDPEEDDSDEEEDEEDGDVEPPVGSSGDVVAGQGIYDAACAGCHRKGSYDPSGPYNNLQGDGNQIRNNMRNISGMGSVPIFSDQEVLDLAAFLDD